MITCGLAVTAAFAIGVAVGFFFLIGFSIWWVG